GWVDAERALEPASRSRVVAQLLVYGRQPEMGVVVLLVEGEERLEGAASRGVVLVLQIELRQQPARAVVVAVLGEEGEGAPEVGARRRRLAVLDERLSGGELKQEVAGCGVGGRDQLLAVG